MNDRLSGAYYGDRLSAERLRRCYDVATPRVARYLRAEIDFALQFVGSGDAVLELGCGYGRVLERLAGRAKVVAGIDTAVGSLEMARQSTTARQRIVLAAADAGFLPFVDGSFDAVFCIQNGMSAFGIDRQALLAEAIRVTKPGGKAVFSSYSEKFWPERLKWFRIQAAHGLLGEIDEQQTGDGVIVCKDGFRAETIGKDEFIRLALEAGLQAAVSEHDESSLFCVYSAK